ncbi:glycosylated lysosomal membrane protein-like [Plodia interpunctella]|uniref:glycosylated lysosomal membrane protein-like n=1 Tax=Plodia interpunctella TaxID=58824 RepID=UPI0023682FE2|nr:glycosylated lysosomal membrane protein-like [Plodia interpunctella]
MQTLTIFIVFIISSAYGQERKITSQLNPNCNYCTKYDTLLYIRADGSHDTVHQIWDFTQGLPTIIFAVSGLNATVNMTWDKGAPQEIWISENPKYSFAVAIDKLYEYNDLQDNGYIDALSPRREISLANAGWLRDDILQQNQEVRLKMKCHPFRKDPRLGTLHFKLDLLPFTDYAVELPHLIHTANSTLVDVSLVNLTQTRDYNASRFALRLVVVGTDDHSLNMSYTMRKSLDDEHTPGVFEIIEIRTPESSSRGDGGFLQFRPVGYTHPERTVSSSTIAHVSRFNKTSVPKDSTLETFYRDFDNDKLLVQNMFLSFGEAGDGYYKQHNFTAWTFTVGYGAPPTESFSTFVLVIIGLGLGVPALLALTGAGCVLARRRRRLTSARLVDDQ